MFGPFWNYKQFTLLNTGCTISKFNIHFTRKHNKYFVGIFVTVPYKLTSKFHKFELIIVHFRNDSRRPQFYEFGKLLVKIYG